MDHLRRVHPPQPQLSVRDDDNDTTTKEMTMMMMIYVLLTKNFETSLRVYIILY